MCRTQHTPIIFLSTPSVRRATTGFRNERNEIMISIHALREEGDTLGGDSGYKTALFLSTPSVRRATSGRTCRVQEIEISIHALREEGDPSFFDRRYHNGRFLSTPSVRRATQPADGREGVYRKISIHALREEGDWAARAGTVSAVEISIHALREEGDLRATPTNSRPRNFYPRPP